jgi:hypothetical protein
MQFDVLFKLFNLCEFSDIVPVEHLRHVGLFHTKLVLMCNDEIVVINLFSTIELDLSGEF